LYNLFTERITLKQTNPDRYIDIVGRGAIELEDIPGRGYIRRGRQPLLFQLAQPIGLVTDVQADTRTEAEEIGLLATQMHAYLKRRKLRYTAPDPINTLPTHVLLQDVMPAASPRRRIEAVLGRDGNLQPAHFDFKRMGPHFTVAGPPLSGKTTVLYSLVLSLALHYPPERAKLVLIDRQRTFFDSGEQHKLHQLPHVVAVASEESQVKALIPHLENECATLKEREIPGEIFVIIDNYDDFNAEIEKGTGAGPSAELARLARRYGREGLHFIISGTLQGTSTTDLRRCIKSSKYGIGLQDVDIFSTFGASGRVVQHNLGPGRGYIVRTGHPLMIQVATPYDMQAIEHAAADEGESDEELLIHQALDSWIEQICARYTTPNPRWIGETESASTAPQQGNGAAMDKQASQMIRVLTRAMQMELAQVQRQIHDTNSADGNGETHTLELHTARMLNILASGGQVDTQELIDHLADIWRTDSADMEGTINDLISSPTDFLSTFEAMNSSNSVR
jgi:hypothetical protein